MISQFGDYYDHIKDMVVNTVIFGLLAYHIYKTNSYIEFFILIIFLFLTLQHLGCQECYMDKKKHKSPSLNVLKNLCPSCNDPEQSLIYTRFFW